MYIGAVAVLPTYVWQSGLLRPVLTEVRHRLLQESKSGKQALREVRCLGYSGCTRH